MSHSLNSFKVGYIGDYIGVQGLPGFRKVGTKIAPNYQKTAQHAIIIIYIWVSG